MPHQNNFRKIRDLIAKGEIDAVIAAFRQLPLSSGQTLELNQISSRYQNLRSQIRQGIISKADENLERNQISHALLDLLNQLDPSGGSSLQTYTSRLPDTNAQLFGRTAELALLDAAWASSSPNTQTPKPTNTPVHLLQFIACGGVGKTALVRHWLDGMAAEGYRGAERVYAWSFYSQGAGDHRQSTAEPFIVAALKWFGEDETQLPNSPHDRGVLLAERIRERRTLLILDGLEPLQYPPGELEGQLKDQGLRALLKELASHNPGLCLLTSRIAVKDIHASEGKTLRTHPLEHLTPEAGAQLLTHLGVKGRPAELQTAVTEFGGHALALRLLGNYLATHHRGDIRRRDRVPKLSDDEKLGGHARRVMEAYLHWFGQDSPEPFQKRANSIRPLSERPLSERPSAPSPELTLLYLTGLFDRPVKVDALDALVGRDAPALSQFTFFKNLTPERQRLTLKHLTDQALLRTDPTDDGFAGIPAHLPGFEGIAGLDAHPLVREYFGEKFRQDYPEVWHQAHATLYEYFKALPEKLYGKHLPDTLEEMEPLFQAVAHGCRAGLQQEALDDVYWERISRKSGFLFNQLGAFGSEATVISCFFDHLWDKPAENLTEADKAVVLSWAGFSLRALGRLTEAAQPMKAGMEMSIKKDDWKGAAADASNLSELYLTAGDVRQAVAFGKQCVEYADRSGDGFEMESDRTTYADALHQSSPDGQSPIGKEAARLFAEAGQMQQKRQPEYQYLYSLRGFKYCDLLLGMGRYEEVLERGKFMVKRSKSDLNTPILTIAVEVLALGKAHLHLSQTHPGGEHRQAAESHLSQAVEGLRKSGNQDDLPRGLLARAAWHRLQGRYELAAHDLAEVFDIAEPGGMRLHLCDYHLESARLCLAQGQQAEAKGHVSKAAKLVAETGYHRRDGEVAELQVAV